ncbi:MAG TPA: ABC transporter permease [Ilumatobacteraceae bacterium]|nr:ABC transporter permease [Ilumatobacteraceae bacterium]
MSDVGERIVTEPEEEEVASAALQRSKFGVRSEVIILYAISLFVALAIAAVCVAGTGGSWSKVYTAMLDGSVRAPGRWGLTLGIAAPVLLVALGTIVNGRAGLVNIGQEGQLVMGSCFAAYAGVRLGGPGPIALVLALLFGIVGGALWAGIAGMLRYYRNVPEVLTTLLMGTVAANLMGYGLRNTGLLLAPAAGRANRNQVSEPLSTHRRIPRVTLFGNEFPLSVLLAFALALVVWLVLDRSVVGFRLRMLGRNPKTAQRSGVAERRYGIGAMLVSGGFAGLAGGVMLAGGDFGNYQLVANFGAGIGFAGLLAALVARQRVIVLIFVAFVFASMRTGSGYLRATGVSGRIADVVQGLLVLALLLPPAVLYVRERRRALSATSTRV